MPPKKMLEKQSALTFGTNKLNGKIKIPLLEDNPQLLISNPDLPNEEMCGSCLKERPFYYFSFQALQDTISDYLKQDENPFAYTQKALQKHFTIKKLLREVAEGHVDCIQNDLLPPGLFQDYMTNIHNFFITKFIQTTAIPKRFKTQKKLDATDSAVSVICNLLLNADACTRKLFTNFSKGNSGCAQIVDYLKEKHSFDNIKFVQNGAQLLGQRIKNAIICMDILNEDGESENSHAICMLNGYIVDSLITAPPTPYKYNNTEGLRGIKKKYEIKIVYNIDVVKIINEDDEDYEEDDGDGDDGDEVTVASSH